LSERVLLITDPRCDRHAAPGHVERPERREAAASGVRDAAGERLEERGATPVDATRAGRVHDPDYLAALERLEREGGGWLDPDTYVVAGSLESARLAAGATAAAAEAVSDGSAGVAFAVMRPPGHHASAAQGTGFCLVNNVAVAVEALRDSDRARRVAIVDWDVHHGHGTQAIFDADPDLCYASTHQSPLYPGTGHVREAGSGRAAGTKHNRPLAPGSGDDAFVAAWRDELVPAVEAFEPEAILVSAGYDAHRADPLAHLEVTEAGYEAVARLVGALSARLRLSGVALTLEGGYDLAALRASAAATVRGLLAGRAEAGSG
jgi:acetoin utilization deacetylase AcuC-like enzyme